MSSCAVPVPPIVAIASRFTLQPASRLRFRPLAVCEIARGGFGWIEDDVADSFSLPGVGAMDQTIARLNHGRMQNGSDCRRPSPSCRTTSLILKSYHFFRRAGASFA